MKRSFPSFSYIGVHVCRTLSGTFSTELDKGTLFAKQRLALS